MTGYLLRRILQMVPTLLGVTVLIFLVVELIPGDPARALLGERASPQALAELREQMGLEDPMPVRYGRFLLGVVQGDLGESSVTHRPITREIATFFPATMELALTAMLLATLLGIVAGVVSAARPGSGLDLGSMGAALVGVSMPIFWLGLLLLLLAVQAFPAGWPLFGRISQRLAYEPWTGLVVLDGLLQGDVRLLLDALRHLLLPTIALATIPLAIIARMTRSSMLEVLGQDYVRTARAKGAGPRAVYFRHALRNAMIPVLTIVGLQFGLLLGGAIITETIFSWPGIGKWILDSVTARDFFAIQGGALVIAVAFMTVNLLVDLGYSLLDPRIRYRDDG